MTIITKGTHPHDITNTQAAKDWVKSTDTMKIFTCTEYSMGFLVMDDAQEIADKIGLNQRADLNKVKFQGSTLYCTDEEKNELIERGILSE